MADERIFLVKKIARDLHAVENQIDEALAGAAALTASLPAARQQAKLSAVVGQEVFETAAAAIAALTEARRQLVAMHGKLDEVREVMGIRPVMFGGGIIKPHAQTAHAPAVQAA